MTPGAGEGRCEAQGAGDEIPALCAESGYGSGGGSHGGRGGLHQPGGGESHGSRKESGDHLHQGEQGPVSPGASGGHRQQEPGGDGGPQPVRGAAGFR